MAPTARAPNPGMPAKRSGSVALASALSTVSVSFRTARREPAESASDQVERGKGTCAACAGSRCSNACTCSRSVVMPRRCRSTPNAMKSSMLNTRPSAAAPRTEASAWRIGVSNCPRTVLSVRWTISCVKRSRIMSGLDKLLFTNDISRPFFNSPCQVFIDGKCKINGRVTGGLMRRRSLRGRKIPIGLRSPHSGPLRPPTCRLFRLPANSRRTPLPLGRSLQQRFFDQPAPDSYRLGCLDRGRPGRKRLGAARFLELARSDLAFVLLARTLGRLGVCAVLVLYGVILWRAFAISRQARRAGKTLAARLSQGIGLWMELRVLTHMGVNLSERSILGWPLPLMSDGGTGLVVTCLAIALLLRADAQTRQAIAVAPTPGPASQTIRFTRANGLGLR